MADDRDFKAWENKSLNKIQIQPKVSVAIVVQHKKGWILAGRRGDTGEIAIPGGKIEYKETAKQAAIRELREETMLIIHEVQLYDLGYADSIKEDSHYVTLGFRCIKDNNENPEDTSELYALAWYDLDELLNHPNLFLPSKQILQLL